MTTTHSSPDGVAAQDDVLMRRVADRDAAAYRLLVQRHAARPHRIAWRMLGDGAEAEDVTQEALLRLWTIAPQWRPGGPGVAAWLTRVTTNLCLDRLRRRARSGSAPLDEETVARIADTTPRADAVLEQRDDRQRVIDALARLPERQRAAIVLTYYEELPNATAAAMLDLHVKAFESLLLRARKALAAMVTGGGYG